MVIGDNTEVVNNLTYPRQCLAAIPDRKTKSFNFIKCVLL